jgi:hypothetical protein
MCVVDEERERERKRWGRDEEEVDEEGGGNDAMKEIEIVPKCSPSSIQSTC